MAIFEYLNPGDNCENIRPRGSVTDVPEDFYNSDSDDEGNVQAAKKGRRRKLKPQDEFFIVLCRLRRGFSEKHLAHLYGVAQSTVSRVFVPWINYMYLKFGQISIWPSKEIVQATMPADFKEKFPTTVEPRSTDTPLLRTVWHSPTKRSYISLKNNPLNTDTR